MYLQSAIPTFIHSLPSCRLELDPETGVITLKEAGALDRETIAEHYLTVEARDHLGQGNR